jgi:hypothetical protein
MYTSRSLWRDTRTNRSKSFYSRSMLVSRSAVTLLICIHDSLAFRVAQDSRIPLPYLYMSILCTPIWSLIHSPLEHKRHNHLYTIRRLSFILALSPIIILARHYSVPIIQSAITADRAITLTQLYLSYNTTETTQWHDWSVTVCVSSTPYQPRHRPIYVNCFTALLLYTPLSRLPKATSRATVSLLYRCFLSLSSRMTSVEGGD